MRCAPRDRLQEGGEDRVAVDEELGVVAVGDRRAGQRLAGAQEAVGADLERLAASA